MTMWAPNARRVGVVVRQLTAGDTDGDGLVASLPQPETIAINAASSNLTRRGFPHRSITTRRASVIRIRV